MRKNDCARQPLGAEAGQAGSNFLGREHDPTISLTGHSQQDPAFPSSQEVPLAFSRPVVGRTHAFIYIEFCPLFGQFPHGSTQLILRAYENPSRAAHCRAHGLGRILKQVKGGEWRIVERAPPPEYREPTGHSYRLVLGPKAACYTPSGARNRVARQVMAELARQGFPTSDEVLRPRRGFVLKYGDVRRRRKTRGWHV